MTIEIADDFDLGKIADSGQCFRVRKFDDGAYRFIYKDHVVYLREDMPHIFNISCGEDEWSDIWVPYFDLNRSYSDICDAECGKNEFVRAAMECGRGLRILRQEPWETLVTFIISQRKNIPAISKSVEMIAEIYGRRVTTGRETLCLFPTADEMALATEQELRECSLGYRAPYVMDAVQRVARTSARTSEDMAASHAVYMQPASFLVGEASTPCEDMPASTDVLDLSALYDYDDASLLAALMSVHGVGKKVANCVALFAYGRTGCVPIDVWIARAINDDCAGESPFSLYGENAGIMQQYVFYYERQKAR